MYSSKERDEEKDEWTAGLNSGLGALTHRRCHSHFYMHAFFPQLVFSYGTARHLASFSVLSEYCVYGVNRYISLVSFCVDVCCIDTIHLHYECLPTQARLCQFKRTRDRTRKNRHGLH